MQRCLGTLVTDGSGCVQTGRPAKELREVLIALPWS